MFLKDKTLEKCVCFKRESLGIKENISKEKKIANKHVRVCSFRSVLFLASNRNRRFVRNFEILRQALHKSDILYKRNLERDVYIGLPADSGFVSPLFG